MTAIVLATVSAAVAGLAGYLLGRAANVQRRLDRRLAKETRRPPLDERGQP